MTSYKITINELNLVKFQNQVSFETGSDLCRCCPANPIHPIINQLYFNKECVEASLAHLEENEKQMLITCVYMHYLNHINDHGAVVGVYTFTKQLWSLDLIKVAQQFQLNWLVTLLTNLNSMLAGPRILVGMIYRLGNELVCVTESGLVMTAAPPNMVAFTVSSTGRNWYALCAYKPDILELWVKRLNNYHTDHPVTWQRLTRTREWTDPGQSTYQLTLSQQCLYVLKNNFRLTCFNLISEQWTIEPILNSEHKLTMIMTRTGDESLPLTLVVNSLEGQIFFVDYHEGEGVFMLTDENRTKIDLIENYQTKAQTTTSKDRWTDMVVIDKTLYGVKNFNTPLINRITYGAFRDSTGWVAGEDRHVVWNPAKEALSVIGMDESDVICLDDEERQINFYGQSLVNRSVFDVVDSDGQRVKPAPPSGLECLAASRVVCEGVRVEFKTGKREEVPPAIQNLLDNLTFFIANVICQNKNVTYNNGGVRVCEEKHPVTMTTQLEVYTINPPTSHMVLKRNLKQLLQRFATCGHAKPLEMGAVLNDTKSYNETYFVYDIID
nr:ORF39C [Acipenserid herpesvirus 1]